MKKTYIAPSSCIEGILACNMIASSIKSVSSNTDLNLGDASDEDARVKGQNNWDDIWSE